MKFYEITTSSDRNPRVDLSIPGSGIRKYLIQGSRSGIRLTD